MADEIADKCAQLQLQNKEEDVVDLSNAVECVLDEKTGLRVMGKLLTKKPINSDALKITMMNIWNLKEGVIIRAIDVNAFIFQFSIGKTRRKSCRDVHGALSNDYFLCKKS